MIQEDPVLLSKSILGMINGLKDWNVKLSTKLSFYSEYYVFRPAPPVPAAGSPLANRKTNSTTENEDMIEVLDTESIYNGTSKRRKVKHPMSRRTLRQRKIHSLKRQIQIKEKMLEVWFLYTSRLVTCN